MGEVVSLLARDDVGAVEADRGEFARRMLPTVLKTTATMLRDRAVNKDGTVVDDPLVVSVTRIRGNFFNSVVPQIYK